MSTDPRADADAAAASSSPGATDPPGGRTGGASALLTRRAALAGALLAALAVYYAVSTRLWQASTWWDIAFLALILIPAVFALVLLGLPLWRARGLLLVGLAFAALAAMLETADLEVPANFAKLAAATGLAFWFLDYFENSSWVALVALIIPVVDAFSVWRGPTHHVLTERREIFNALSFAFPVPGEEGAANLGIPDLLFFALFLAACARFGLRTRWTWLAMTLSFGATLALAVWLDVAGLPALPLLSLAFVAVNADLLWRAWRGRGQAADATTAG